MGCKAVRLCCCCRFQSRYLNVDQVHLATTAFRRNAPNVEFRMRLI